MGWIWHQTQPAALLFNSTRCFSSWILVSFFCEYFQIHRQPDPYISHCVDSWADTAIQVPESTNYSLAVDRCSKHIWKYFLYTSPPLIFFAYNFMYCPSAVVPTNVSPEGNCRDLQLLLAQSLTSLLWRVFHQLFDIQQVYSY